MQLTLNEKQVTRITQILNEFPIREMAKVQAISQILSESNTPNEDEPNTED